MNDYYCKNCNSIIGKWNNYYKWYDILKCYFSQSKNCKSIFFLDCIKCKKFVGLECWNVCQNCFGEKEIIGEKNLFNFFLKYKKTLKKYQDINDSCKICNKNKFRNQYWFFEELTFYIK